MQTTVEPSQGHRATGRDTGINLPPCGEPPLPSNDMFEALSSTVSILQREVRYLYFIIVIIPV